MQDCTGKGEEDGRSVTLHMKGVLCLAGCLYTPCLHYFTVSVMCFMRLCEKGTLQDDREKGKGKKREKNWLEGMTLFCFPMRNIDRTQIR